MREFDRLVEIMSRLRGPAGCPWDLEQTHKSLKPYLIEEAYEVLDAIDGGDDRELCEELGDLLLQVVFHAQIASEEGRFRVEEIAASISDKLLRRHPHVFGDANAADAREVLKNWEVIKSREKRKKGAEPATLSGIPRHLPALLRAARIQEKAAKAGVDWTDPGKAKEKASEDWKAFLDAGSSGDPDRIEEGLGDLLFALVNVAHLIQVSPEEALRKTVDKFETRFRFIESELRKDGSDPRNASPEEMDRLWRQAKEHSR
jgi:MazG family protein